MLNAVWSANVTLFCMFLYFVEIPAMNDWNPFHQHTPNIQHPRIGFQLVLNDSNYGTGFNVW